MEKLSSILSYVVLIVVYVCHLPLPGWFSSCIFGLITLENMRRRDVFRPPFFTSRARVVHTDCTCTINTDNNGLRKKETLVVWL